MNMKFLTLLIPIVFVFGTLVAQTDNKISSNFSQLNPQEMLHKAILNDSAEEVEKAFQLGANVNSTRDGKSHILWAILLKKSNAVEALLNCDAYTDKTFIEYAINLRDIKTAVILAIKRTTNLDSIYLGHTLLHHAMINGDLKSACVLIKNGANMYDSWNSSLRNLKESLYMRLANDCNMPCDTSCNPCNNTDNNMDALNLLQEMINCGYNVNSLWFGVDGNAVWGLYLNEKAVKLLIKNGANPNHIFSNSQGSSFSPLFRAIEYRSLKVVKILLDAGASINQKATGAFVGELQTPLSYAIKNPNSSPEIIEFLLEHSAEL